MHRALVFLLGALVSLAALGGGEITLYALFEDKAILLIDGKRRLVRVGASTPEGVELLATDTATEEAEVRIDGRIERLRLGVVLAPLGSGAKGSVVLYPDGKGQFFADGAINGVAVRFLVDTGASSIALSSAHARRIGLDYRGGGRRGFATTAGGVVPMYGVKLREVRVGEITLHGVDAGVIEGNFPIDILLGMSFLGQVDMRQRADRLELHER